MGASKLLGERLVIAANNIVGSASSRFSLVRFGNILNSSGSVVEIFREQIARGRPLVISSLEMTRFFLTNSDAVNLCLYAAENMAGGEIFVQNMRVFRLQDLVKAMAPDRLPSDHIIQGPKVGEKLFEELLSEHEKNRAYKLPQSVIVLPEICDYLPEESKRKHKMISKFPKLSQPLKSNDFDFIQAEELRHILENIENE